MQQQQGGAPASGRRQTAMLTCPKSMVGRVIGRDGDTIKALQTFTGALIQIDQTSDPTKIAISGNPHSLNMALSMVHDIVRGTFKGFALLRQATGHSNRGPQPLSNKPVYAPGYGLVPPSQLYGGTGDIASAQVVGPPPAAAAAMGLISTTPVAAAAAGVVAGGGGMLAAGGGGMGQQQAAGGGYPQLLSAAGPPQFMVPMQPLQPMQMSTTPLPGPVYNVISAPGYSGPVFFSPMEYANLTAAGLGPAGGNGGRPAGGTGVIQLSSGSNQHQLGQHPQPPQIQYYATGGIGIGGGGMGMGGGGGGGLGATATSTAAADHFLYASDQGAASASSLMAAGGAGGRLFHVAGGGAGGGAGGNRGGGGGAAGPSAAAAGASALEAAQALLAGGGHAAGVDIYDSPASAAGVGVGMSGVGGGAGGAAGTYMLAPPDASARGGGGGGGGGGQQQSYYGGGYGLE
ncbi:hypothetical protein CHLRE_15g640200v5 [Chlamydomonas reinhardtii]|uniref:K Homology domain-containing protein n=1 Tax=Chlamydomonas reinhardtii TaxID=3055 RepID=A0A2K3CWM6_CHLRE|nr:uncharacterized protein CHLRE_15g640200v5 [Chlamydomonas reinhardtii]PNW72685.1 hypothetical protein CHLRE_15g640200v5 [Chlamydomonas reinhardtii]